jgi:hypothetical protein
VWRYQKASHDISQHKRLLEFLEYQCHNTGDNQNQCKVFDEVGEIGHAFRIEKLNDEKIKEHRVESDVTVTSRDQEEERKIEKWKNRNT